MPITSTSVTSAASVAANSTVVTTNQDRVRQQMATAASKAKDDAQAARDADANARDTASWYNALPAKDKTKADNLKKYNDAQAYAQTTKRQAAQSKKDLEKLTNVDLPAAIQADQQATEANKAREKQIEDEAQESDKAKADREAEANKQSSDDTKAATGTGTGQAQKTAKKPTEGSAVVGAAATGAQETEEAAEPAAKAAPAPEGDDYEPAASQPAKTQARYSSGSSMLPSEGEEPQERVPSRQNGQAAPVKTTAPATGGAEATGGQAAGATVGASGASSAPAATAADFSGLVTDSGVRWDDFTDGQKAYIIAQYNKIKDAAKDGDVEKTMKSMMDSFWMDLGQESGVAATDGTDKLPKGKSQPKQGKATVGAAGQGATALTGGDGGAAVTAAGNSALSTQAGATGATVGAAAPRQAVQAFVAQPNTLGGSSKLSAPSGATVGAAGDTGATLDVSNNPETDEISRGYFGGMSPMELVQMVMLLAFKEAGENVRNAAEMMQEQTKQKQAIRASQDALRPQISINATGGQDSASKAVSNQMDSLSSKLDSIGDDNQILMIRLQNLTQLLTTMSQATSNISKAQSDATKSIVGKIGG